MVRGVLGLPRPLLPPFPSGGMGGFFVCGMLGCMASKQELDEFAQLVRETGGITAAELVVDDPDAPEGAEIKVVRVGLERLGEGALRLTAGAHSFMVMEADLRHLLDSA